jgi:hypothetical protein
MLLYNKEKPKAREKALLILCQARHQEKALRIVDQDLESFALGYD